MIHLHIKVNHIGLRLGIPHDSGFRQIALSQISQTVIPVGEIDEPLAYTPPTLIDADWDNGQLKLVLDRPVTQDWVHALQNMGNYTSVMGIGPENFRFRGNEATVGARPGDVQQVINYFKDWLPRATSRLKQDLLIAQKRHEYALREKLRIEKEKEEQRLSVLRNIKI